MKHVVHISLNALQSTINVCSVSFTNDGPSATYGAGVFKYMIQVEYASLSTW